MSFANTKVDQYNSWPDRGHIAQSSAANQCRRNQPNTGPVRLHNQRHRSARCLRCGESNDDETPRVQRIRFGPLRLLQQHAEPEN